MTKLSKAHYGIGAFVILCFGIIGNGMITGSSEREAGDKVKTSPSSPDNSLAMLAQPKAVKDTDKMAFKVAPEYNDFYAASQLIANAVNPALEKDWIKHRLGTRIARENAAREKAELEEKQYKFEKLQVAAQIDVMEQGHGSLDLATLTQALTNPGQTNSMNGSQMVPANETIKITAMNEGDEVNTVTLLIGQESYKNLSVGARAKQYTVTEINTLDICVSLKDKYSNNQTICMG